MNNCPEIKLGVATMILNPRYSLLGVAVVVQ